MSNIRTARDTARPRQTRPMTSSTAASTRPARIIRRSPAPRPRLQAAETNVGIAQQAVADTRDHARRSPVIVSAGPSRSANLFRLQIRWLPRSCVLIRSRSSSRSPRPTFRTWSLAVASRVQVDAYKDRNFAGYVSAVNPQVDPTSRAASVEALIDNSNNLLRPECLPPFGSIREGGSTGCLRPEEPPFYNDQATQSYRVFEIQDNVAKLRVVQLGTEEGDADPDLVRHRRRIRWCDQQSSSNLRRRRCAKASSALD